MPNQNHNGVGLLNYFPTTAAVGKASEPERLDIPTIPYQPPAWAQPDPERKLGEALILLQRARNLAGFVRRWAQGEPVLTKDEREYTLTEIDLATEAMFGELETLGGLILRSIGDPPFQQLSASGFRPCYVVSRKSAPDPELDEIERGAREQLGPDWRSWTPEARVLVRLLLDALKQRDVLYRALRDTVQELLDALESIYA